VFMHDVGLAFRSIRRNPVLSALMVVAIGSGIAASLVTMTIYHGRAGHPIPWKADRLYAVTMDTRDEDRNNAFSNLVRNPEYPPFQVTFRDAKAIYESDIPTRAVMMFRSGRTVAPLRPGDKPFQTGVRVTTADFFAMFDVPFLYGSGWTRSDDTAPAPVVVLSRFANEKLFGGENSVGREITVDEGRTFRVIGVLDSWTPQPKFYDLNNYAFDIPENIYMPFGWTEVLKLPSWGSTNCVRSNAKVGSFEQLLVADCVWLQYWAELPTKEHLERYQRFVDSYVTDQKRFGRFPRPGLNNRIVDVDEWMRMFDVVGDESRMQLALAFLFLIVCVLNTFGLMLAKFLKSAPISGLRRALGASRADIMRQHLMEVVVVGLMGGALGLLLSFLGLNAMRRAMNQPVPGNDNDPSRLAVLHDMTSIDFTMFAAALVLSLFTGVLAGLYPAWRIGRLTPSTFLKTQ